MKLNILFAVLAIAFFTSCKKSNGEKTKLLTSPSESFFPLQIGNYWRINDQNYSEVKDTLTIKGELYYQVSSLTGGDAFGENYYRINQDQELISTSPRYPDYRYTHAKFNANLGDTFQTLGDKSVNDYKVTVVEKTDTRMTFSFDMIYHPNLKGHPHTVTYLKGLGWDDRWKTICIDGKIISK